MKTPLTLDAFISVGTPLVSNPIGPGSILNGTFEPGR